MQDDFGIDPGGENLPLLEQLGTEGFSIGQRAIVGQRYGTKAGIQRQRLNVLQPRPAHGRISDVADRAVAVEVEAARVGGEVVGDQPGGLVGLELPLVQGHDASAFLPPVLLCVQSQSRVKRSVFKPEHGEQTTFFLQSLNGHGLVSPAGWWGTVAGAR